MSAMQHLDKVLFFQIQESVVLLEIPQQWNEVIISDLLMTSATFHLICNIAVK